jgi:HlyD family secretion protein
MEWDADAGKRADMHQIVKKPAPQAEIGIAEALGLDSKGRPRKRKRRRSLYALLAVALLGTGYGGYEWFTADAAAVTYTTVPAAKDELTVTVSATGTLQPLTQVDISSELSGVMRTVLVNENGLVKKGDVLAELDTTRIAAQVDGARASALAAEAKVEDARTTLSESDRALTRAQQLSKQALVTEQALETAQATRDRAASAVKMAEANLAIAQAELKQRQTDLEKSKIYAPIDGIVLTRSVDPGQTVASSLQAPVLFVIAADLAKMELKAAIDEADIGGVKPGQQARFTVDAFPDRSFDALIRDISYASITTDGVVTYDARLDVDNAELLLRPGMTATVSVVTREAKDVITVPATAFRFRPPVVEKSRGWSLQRLFMPRIRMGGNRGDQQPQSTDGSRTLYVLKDGAPQPVKVKTGSTDGEKTEIVSGLGEGDPVIVGLGQARQRQ